MSAQHLLKQRKVAMLALILSTSLTFAACTTTTNSTVVPPAPGTEELPVATMAPESDEMMRNATDNDDRASASGKSTMMDSEGQVRTIDVEAGSFYYTPNEIRVKKGEKIKLVLNSVDMIHDFNIDELGVKIPVTKGGSSATIEFTANTAGTFEYYCSVGQHRANGQVGTIIVE